MRIRLSAYALATVFCLTAAYQTQGQITIRPPVRELSADGGGGYILTSGTGSWTAKTTADWISIQPRTSGEADESCIYVVRKNKSSEPRDAQIFINDNVHTVIQYGDASPSTSESATLNKEADKVVTPEKSKAEFSTPASEPVAPVSYQAPAPMSYTRKSQAPVISAPSGRFELRGGINYYIPGGSAATGDPKSIRNSVEWSSGLGVDVQGIYWFDKNWGCGLSIGSAKWDVEDYYHKRYNPVYRINEIDTLSGDADLVIVGASLTRKITSGSSRTSKLYAEVEAGIRSVTVDSNITGRYAQQFSDGTRYQYQELETDGGILGFLAINGGYELSPQLKLIWQAGYQFDLDKGEVINKVSGIEYPAGETELGSFITRFGASLNF